MDQLLLAVRLRAAGAKWDAIASRMDAPSGTAARSAVYRHKGKLDLRASGYGFALIAQDWRGHRVGTEEPPPEVDVFDTAEQAEAAKGSRPRDPEVLLCVLSVERIMARRNAA